MKPLVSIAIITYNQKQYLKECIESVLLQDYPNLQIVVADDCSTDGSQELILEYQKRYPKIIKPILSKKNLGITGNSNAAFFNCDGEYIAWIGGDDLMLPGKISAQVEFLENNQNYSICYHDMTVFDSESGKTLGNYNSGLYSIPPKTGTVSNLIKRNFIAASSAISRKSASPNTGFDVRLPWVSDWFFYIETAMNGPIGYLPNVYGKYRKHLNSFSSTPERLDADFTMTLAILDSKYPSFFKATRIARAKYFYNLGIRQIRTGNKKVGKRYLIESLKLSFFPNWKAGLWIFLSLINSDFRERILKSYVKY